LFSLLFLVSTGLNNTEGFPSFSGPGTRVNLTALFLSNLRFPISTTDIIIPIIKRIAEFIIYYQKLMMFVEGLIPLYGGSFNKASLLWLLVFFFLSNLKLDEEKALIDLPVIGLYVI